MPEQEVVNGGVRRTEAKVSLSGKPFGVDLFLTMSQEWEFDTLVTEGEAVIKRSEMAELLTDQILGEIKVAASQIKTFTDNNPRGNVSLYPVNPPLAQVSTPAPAQTWTPQPATGNPIMDAANGAGPVSDWAYAPNRIQGQPPVKYLTVAAYPKDVLIANAKGFVAASGFDPDKFVYYDERPAMGAVAGPLLSICNIKIGTAYLAQVPESIAYIVNKAGAQVVAAVARVQKFNDDGSLWIKWEAKTADAIAQGQYNTSLNALKLGAPLQGQGF